MLIDKILSNLNNFADLGGQRAFELGNPYYYQAANDNEYWRKEMPTGEIFLVLFEVKYDQDGHPIKIVDTFQERIS
ncbi:hypothetical protein [Pedobacter psychrodurus]|uniref:hypothetical protein n=1 Tax=Pedobacter psychrodurus TaxID=2530456 RepID=UPI0029312ACF|nr:hypothetical protein [Pedobacter psychrodurus]